MTNELYLMAIMYAKAIVVVYAAFKSINIPFWVINKLTKKN